MEARWMWSLVMLSVLVGLTSVATATSPLAPREATPAASCHTLMTDMECAAFHVALSQTLPGASRERLMAEYQDLVRERESACSCARPAQAAVAYPRVRQVALRL